ncbi:hypothetical protein HOF92_05265 [bacterium]|jgi:hypothetical protein|nr:hypothetical protein [bacterium]
MAIRYNKPIQYMDLGTYSIKHGVFKVNKETEEVESISREIYKVPNPYSGADLYLENFGQYLKEMVEHLDRKLPIRFSVSSLFAPTNLAYLTRIEKEQVETRMREELEKFASQEKIPPENEHNTFFELFSKEIENRSQVIAATILLNPKYVGMLRNQLYAHNLKFGGVVPILQSIRDVYERLINIQPELKEKPLVFVDIGFMTTKVNLFFEEQLLFNKVLHYGSKSFHDELFDFASKSGDSALSPIEVEEVLQKVGFSNNAELVNQMGFDINDPSPYLHNMDQTLKSIFTKVNSSINYFTSALARNFSKDNAAFMTIRKGATNVFLSGGITNAPAFFDKARQSFNCSIHVLHPFNLKGTLDQTESMFQQEDFRLDLRMANPYIDCVGGALLGLDSARAESNLVSKVDSENENILQILRKLPLAKYRNGLFAILCFILAQSGWKYISVSGEFETLRKQTGSAKKKLEISKRVRDELLELRKTETLNQSRLDYIRMIMKDYSYWPRVLQLLMTKLGPDIKLTGLKFTTAPPSWHEGKATKWEESEDEKEYPWTDMAIQWELKGDALARSSVPNLIQSLKDTGIFIIPKPPATKFVPEQERKKRGSKRGEEEFEIISAHYEFVLQGTIKLDNPI